MFELFQNLYLAIGALGICRVLECIKDLFECENSFGRLLFYFPDMAVSTRSYLFKDVEASEDMTLDESGVILGHKLNGMVIIIGNN